MKRSYQEDEMVELSDNSNLALFGKPNRKLFEEDMIHLRKGGSALLASNICYSVIKALKINLSTRRYSQYRYDGRTSPRRNIPGFCSFQIDRPKVKKARKGYDGIVVLAKKEMRKGVTFIKSTVLPHDAIWVKLSKTVFKGWSENVFLCVAYFSPANSSYTTRTGIDFFRQY